MVVHSSLQKAEPGEVSEQDHGIADSRLNNSDRRTEETWTSSVNHLALLSRVRGSLSSSLENAWGTRVGRRGAAARHGLRGLSKMVALAVDRSSRGGGNGARGHVGQM